MTFAVGTVSDDRLQLMRVTEDALYQGIAQARPGNHLSDIGHAIQTHVESYGYGVVRELVGHGVGRELHEPPEIPNYGEPGRGPVLKPGMCLAIEPMITMGSYEVRLLKDGWTVITEDHLPSAHYEHTIAIGPDGPQILSQRG
ncbi:MAG TPA: M24 family metallopeptidase, partial [Candidatus Marinimicrobia bacterium]|nr:M24 family metallopeptidase [Candidatus Neomarinimicrobiota bacterium]